MAADLLQREAWAPVQGNTVLWRPIVKLNDDTWVHAQWLDWLGNVRELQADQRFLQVITQDQHHYHTHHTYLVGCMLPCALVEVVRQIHPEVGLFQAYLSQWVPGWSTVTFQNVGYDAFPGLMNLSRPSEVNTWWIDDIFCPHSEGWWNNFIHLYEHQLDVADPVYLAAVYYGSTGHMVLEAIGCTWVIRIPAGALKMRTSYSTIQQSHQPDYHAVYSRNPEVLLIGVLANPPTGTTIAQQSLPTWIQTLRQSYTIDWLIAEWLPIDCDHISWHHPIFEWCAVDSSRAKVPTWWVRVRQQLDRLELEVYNAPKGWRRYPTMTKRSAHWSEAVSYTGTGAKNLHRHVMWRTWCTLRDYWNYTFTTIDNEVDDVHRTLLDNVNTGIKSRRQEWARNTTTTFNRRLQDRRDLLQENGQSWRGGRNAAIARDNHDS